MKIRNLVMLALAIVLGGAALAQEPQAPPAGQGGGRGYGRGAGMGFGRGVMGTVTEVAADHYTIKNDQGETWTIHYSANTRIMKQPPRPAGEQARGQGQGEGQNGGEGGAMRGGPPEPIKATDIKVGDAIMAMGETDQSAKSIGAVMVMQLDPAVAKRMEEMRANYGKTWLAGRVTSINETTVTLQGMVDNTAHTFTADENTTFRKRRDPITLADIQVGDMVRVEGAVKGGQFVATTVSVMGAPQARGGPVPRPGPPPQ
jgi:preprotein translocase subunit YajC